MLGFIKGYIVRRKIARNLRRIKKSVPPSEIHKIAVLIDMDRVKMSDEIEKLIDYFELRADNYIFLGYKNNSEETHVGTIPVISSNDFSYKGIIKNYHVDRLVTVHYDLLLNLFDEPVLELMLLSSAIDAKLLVGILGTDYKINDISIKTIDIYTFIVELKKLLKTLNI